MSDPGFILPEKKLVNPYEQAQLQKILNNWRLTPATFAQKLSRGGWIPAPWLQYASIRVASAVARGRGRIIISAPPRHGKSELISINTSAWALENFPKKAIILASYGADLSEGFGRRVRDMFVAPENQDLLSVRLQADSRKVGMWHTQMGGYMASVGLGGAITGRGADILLIDDYIKEIKEALSPTYRDYIWNWYVTTARTRLEPNATVIIIATRWHSDDLIGRLVKAQPGLWEVITFPAIAKEDEAITGRKAGEALFPERYDLEALAELHETLGTIFFSALFQQEPVDETKKLSDGAWLRIVPNIPDGKWSWARIWDLAATQGGGDYTVGTKMGYDRKQDLAIITHISRDQLSPDNAEQEVQRQADIDGPSVPIYIEEEPGASGKALTNHYQKNVLPGFVVKPIPATNKKLVRAQPFLAAAEHGKIMLLKSGWNDVFVKEFDAFPASDWDDQVDTASAGYTQLSGKKIFSASWGRRATGSNYQTKQNSRNLKAAQSRLASSSMKVYTGVRVKGATFGRSR